MGLSMEAIQAVELFKLNGKIVSCEPYGNGHINTTYKVVTDDGAWYILQKIIRSPFATIKA